MQKLLPSNFLIGRPIEKGMILLIGPPGSGKTIFSYQFAVSGLEGGEPCIIVTVDQPPEELRETLNRFSFDISPYEEKSILRIVDCYSWRVRQDSKARYVVRNPANLNDVSITIEDARLGLDRCRIVLDSITMIALDAGLSATEKFLQVLSARIKLAGALGLCILQEGVHGESFVNLLKAGSDVVLETKIEEKDGELLRFMRIYSIKTAAHSSKWFPFKITQKGLIFT